MSVTDPRASVCVPVYNGAAYLDACLESILAQTATDFEVVVVDDGSTDESLEIARRFAMRDARVTVHRNPVNLGLTGNWKRSVDLARGEWIKFVFQDDLMHPHCLERLLEHARIDVGLVACHRDLLFEPAVSAEVRAWYERHAAFLHDVHPRTTQLTPTDAQDLILENLNANLFGEPTSVLLHREVFRRYGPFREDLVMACDLEYWNRVAVNEGAVFVAETLVAFRVHETAVSANNRNRQRYRSGTLDSLLVLRAYATEDAFAPLRARGSRRVPPVELAAVFDRRKHEVRASAAWSRQAGWSEAADAGEAIGNLYQRFPDLRPPTWSHLLWRLQLRFGRPVRAKTGHGPTLS